MKSLSQLLLFLLISFTSAFVSNFVQESDRVRYLSVITESQDPQSYLFENSLTSTVFGIEVLDLLDKDVPNVTKLCSSLNKLKPKKDDIYQWLILISKLDCSVNLPPPLTTKLQKALEKPRFTPLHLSITSALALFESGKLAEDDIDFSVLSFTFEKLFDESGFVRESQKESSGSPYKTSQAMLLVKNLVARFPKLKESLSETIATLKSAVPGVLKAGKKTSGQLVFQGSLTATVSVLSGICEFSQYFSLTPLDVTTVNRIAKYILSNKYAETVTGARMVLTGAHYLATNPFHQPVSVTVTNPTLNLEHNDGSRFIVSLQTMDGSFVDADSISVASLTEIATGKTIAEGGSFTKNKRGAYEYSLRTLITEMGLYSIKVDLTLGEESAGVTRQVRAVSSLNEVKAIIFDFNKRQGVSKVSDEDKTRMTYGKTTKKAKVSLTGIRETRLEVVTKGFKPEQMFAKFTYQGDCQLYEVCSFNVPGTSKSRKYQWRVDLSKEPYSNMFRDGTYSVSVMVGGIFISTPVEWELGTIEVTMPVEDDMDTDYEPIDDLTVYWHPQEPIEHTFAPPPVQPNMLLALLFTVIVLSPLFAFFQLREKFAGRVEFNVSGNGMFYQISILSTMSVIAGYWFALNLFQAMNLAVLVVVTTFFFGYRTVKEINVNGGFQ